MHYFAVFTEKDGIYLLKLRKFEEDWNTMVEAILKRKEEVK